MGDVIKDLAERLRTITPEKDYFALTLTATDDGTVQWACQTQFVRYDEGPPMLELRAASLVHPGRMGQLWTGIGEAWIVVDDELTLSVFLRVGGHALIEQTLAKQYLPEVLAPRRVTATGLVGHRLVEEGDPGLRRSPTPKQRMRILKRDNGRCRVCGRSPEDSTDVALHVHHVRPYGVGGLTDDDNLLTLCHTCHTGLEPHNDFALYAKLPLRLPERTEHERGVGNYRRLIREQAKQLEHQDGGSV